MDNQEKIELEKVKYNGLALCLVKHQTPEICLAAVRQHGLALEYVINQTKFIIDESLLV